MKEERKEERKGGREGGREEGRKKGRKGGREGETKGEKSGRKIAWGRLQTLVDSYPCCNKPPTPGAGKGGSPMGQGTCGVFTPVVQGCR